MSRKSIHTVNFLCGVSIMALAGTGCFIMETAQAGQASKRSLTAAAIKAPRLKAANSRNRLSSRGISRFSVQKRALKSKTLANDRRFIKSKAGHRITKTRGPSVGNSRLSIGGINAHRLKKLARKNHVPGVGRIGKIRNADAKKKSAIAPNETPLLLNFEKIRKKKARSLSSKASHTNYKLDNVMVKSWSVSGGADDRPATRHVSPVDTISLNFEPIENTTNFDKIVWSYAPFSRERGGSSELPTEWRVAEDGETGFLSCLTGNTILCGLAVGYFVGKHIDISPHEPSGQCSCKDGPDGSCC